MGWKKGKTHEKRTTRWREGGESERSEKSEEAMLGKEVDDTKRK